MEDPAGHTLGVAQVAHCLGNPAPPFGLTGSSPFNRALAALTAASSASSSSMVRRAWASSSKMSAQPCLSLWKTRFNKPAGSLPPGHPQRVLADVGLGGRLSTELGRQPGLNLTPPLDEIVPGAEGEDIFDSFVESIAGRRQYVDPPSPS
jgi:hypothetical protein